MRNNRAMTLAPHRIAVLAVDQVVGLDLGTPAQVFGTARTGDQEQLYTVDTCTAGARPVRSTAGFQVLPDHGLELIEAADTVIVPGIHGGPPLVDGTVDPDIAAALRA
ncbi:MAG: AraC family transcriptional regulator, partial [Micromonospora sp.]